MYNHDYDKADGRQPKAQLEKAILQGLDRQGFKEVI